MAPLRGYLGAFWAAAKHAVRLDAGETVAAGSAAQIAFDSDASFSLELWVRLGIGAGDGAFCYKDLTDAGYGFLLATNKAAFKVFDGTNSDVVTSTASVNTSDWLHLMGVRDVPGNKMKIYVNGESDVAATLIAGDLTEGSDLVVGHASAQVDLSLLRVYSGVVTSAQVSDLHNGDFPGGLISNVVAEYVVEEGSGAKLLDSSKRDTANNATTDGAWITTTYNTVTEESVALASSLSGSLAHKNVDDDTLTVTVSDVAKDIDTHYSVSPTGKIVFHTAQTLSDVAHVTYRYYPQVAEAGGFTNWAIDVTAATHDTTDFRTTGWRSFIPGMKEWTGRAERHWVDSLTHSIAGEKVILRFYDSEDSDLYYTGWGYVSGIHPNEAVDTLLDESLDFRGRRPLGTGTA